MKTWIPVSVLVIVVIAVIAWIELGLAMFVAIAILPYLVLHLIVREDYIHSIQHCTTEYLSHKSRHLSLN
jgi:hypothetical protein